MHSDLLRLAAKILGVRSGVKSKGWLNDGWLGIREKRVELFDDWQRTLRDKRGPFSSDASGGR